MEIVSTFSIIRAAPAGRKLPEILEALSKEGHDVLWIRTHAPGLKDKDVLHLAADDNRIVLTLDKDFRQLALDNSYIGKYGVILFRIHPAIPSKIIPLLLKTLALELDWVGHISVVSENGVGQGKLR